mgnify:CR=1 FL=1
MLESLYKTRDGVMGGDYSALIFYDELVALEKEIEIIKNSIMEYALDQASRSDTHKVIERQSYSYKNLDEWVAAKAALSTIGNKYKLAWENSVNNMIAVDEGGEVMPLPEVKFSQFIKKL